MGVTGVMIRKRKKERKKQRGREREKGREHGGRRNSSEGELSPLSTCASATAVPPHRGRALGAVEAAKRGVSVLNPRPHALRIKVAGLDLH